MSNVINLTDQTKVQSQHGVVLVDFWAPWCGPCRTLSPVLEELADDFLGAVKIMKVNVDENSVLTSEYHVRSIPAVFIMKDGMVLEKLIGGGKSKADYTAAINKHLG